MQADTDSTILLIRTTELTDQTLSFADTLGRASGHPIAFVVDERNGAVDHRGRQVVSLTAGRCQEIGLFCPPDFAWKCGDYGYYLARAQFPGVRWFWLIEDDVRFGGGDPRTFFQVFEGQPEVDFVAPRLRVAESNWYWTATAASRDAEPHRCLFPVTRMSSDAIDAARRKRLQHSRRWLRRLLWPNDEVLVATTLAQAGMVCRDVNDFGSVFYSNETFTFRAPIDGASFAPANKALMIYHPVLFGDAYARKVIRLRVGEPKPRWDRHTRPWVRRLNGWMRW